MVSIYLFYPQGDRISKFRDGETSKDYAILDPDSKGRLPIFVDTQCGR